MREALDLARDRMELIFEKNMSRYCKTPWKVRNAYIDIIFDRSKPNLNKFLRKHIDSNLSDEEKTHVMRMLEMQRNAMLMYTSCGWFFNDVSGIETLQILQYACRAIQLAESESREIIEKEFLDKLSESVSNIPEQGTAKDIYLKIFGHFNYRLLKWECTTQWILFFRSSAKFNCSQLRLQKHLFERKSAGVQNWHTVPRKLNRKLPPPKRV